MARYKSIIQLRGKIGDLVYRRYGGINFVGAMTGPTAEQILTAPEFANTRKNMAEFGACADFAEDIIKQIDKRNTQVSGKIWTGQRKILSQLMQIRKLDLIHPFGQRTINANSTLEGIVLEKKGNFNFDFIQFRTEQLYKDSTTAKYYMFPKQINILENCPDQSGNWYIRITIQLIQQSRIIYNTDINKYIKYRSKLDIYDELIPNTRTRNNNFSEFDTFLSSLLLPMSPIIDNEDYFLVLLSKELLKKTGNIIHPTQNYITTIHKCNTII